MHFCSDKRDIATCGPPLVRLFFRFRWDVKNMKVRVCGNHPGLGDWKPADSMELITYKDIYPCWISNTPIEVPLNQSLEYKYVIEKDDRVEWENFEGNRCIKPSGREMTVEDDDGLFRDHGATRDAG